MKSLSPTDFSYVILKYGLCICVVNYILHGMKIAAYLLKNL